MFTREEVKFFAEMYESEKEVNQCVFKSQSLDRLIVEITWPGHFAEMDRGEDEGWWWDQEAAERAENERGQPCKTGKVKNAELNQFFIGWHSGWMSGWLGIGEDECDLCCQVLKFKSWQF